MTEYNPRRRRLNGLVAVLVIFFAWAGLVKEEARPGRPPKAKPPLTAPASVSYRPDGGQRLDPSGFLKANTLTRLNCGRAIDLLSAEPDRLAHLPSLGSKSAAKAAESGCLNSRQRKILDGIVTETCKPNKP